MSINYINSYSSINFKIADDFSVMETYKCGRKELVNLCGGVPSLLIEDMHVEAVSVNPTAIRVNVNSNLYRVVRTIDFGLKRIANLKMRVFQPGNQIGKKLFINQLKAAMNRGFRALTTMAQASNPLEKWEGSVFWAKIGYKMSDYDDIKDFEKMMAAIGKPGLTLEELVLTSEGCELWRRDGFDWLGKFEPWQGSESMIQLRKYLISRGMEWMLD